MAASLVRIGFAWALGLGVDESYMVATGRALRFGYFDHPPAAWWMQWAAAQLFGTEAPLAVRLPFIAAFALSTWLMYRLGTAVADRRAGLWAAVLLTLSPVFGVTTGSWVLPDGPLELALLGAALCLVHALAARARAGVPWWIGAGWWVGAGLCAGLALFSKYTAVLTIGGAFVYLLSSPAHRRWLARPEPYVAGLLALAVFAPVLAWNAAHHWASFAFQGDRALGLRFRPLQFFVVLGGEALFVLPWIWAPMMAAFLAALRRGSEEWRAWLLVCLGFPPIIGFALIAVISRDRVLYHWAAPGYLMLFPLLGAAVAARIHLPSVRRWLTGTAVLILAAIVIVSTQIRLDWMHPAIAAFARHDPDLAGIDWTSLRTQLTARGLLAPGVVVGVPNWSAGGKIAYALGPGVTVVCLNRDARQFGFDAPAARFAGRTLLVLAPGQEAARNLAGYFASVTSLPSATIRDRGVVLQRMSVFLGHGLRPIGIARGRPTNAARIPASQRGRRHQSR
ncbi:MAG: glycosyltransferase family 39 protein [Acetobacteraceae bacterium]